MCSKCTESDHMPDYNGIPHTCEGHGGFECDACAEEYADYLDHEASMIGEVDVNTY